MPKTLRLADGGYVRRLDVHPILEYLRAMQCVQVVGFSNVGKSSLLRLLAQPDVWTQEVGEAGQDFVAVYIDCNRMLRLTEQGFYELVLRCLQESGSPLGATLAALPEVAAAYETLIAAASEFQAPLAFTRGLTAALSAPVGQLEERRTVKLALLFDEFDEPFAQIDSRVLLNLRALRDRHSAQLVYVTATNQPLRNRSDDGHAAEFCELFNPYSWYLAPLTRSDVDRLVRQYADAYEANFSPSDADFIYQWTGGHPPMVDEVCRLLETVLDQAGEAGSLPDRREVAPWGFPAAERMLRGSEMLTLECTKIWDECSAEEQGELIRLVQADYRPNPAVLAGLLRRHLVHKMESRYVLFSRLMGEFVQRKATQPQPESSPEGTSLWVDIDSGQVLVCDAPVETLTALEYRLMRLLFQNADKIVDKYQIVSQVWGDNYIDEVDDARIEKLVSRVRQKVEPDPANPRFLVTVRGRGYRLTLNHAGATREKPAGQGGFE